jgi:hypothetical protein
MLPSALLTDACESHEACTHASMSKSVFPLSPSPCAWISIFFWGGGVTMKMVKLHFHHLINFYHTLGATDVIMAWDDLAYLIHLKFTMSLLCHSNINSFLQSGSCDMRRQTVKAKNDLDLDHGHGWCYSSLCNFANLMWHFVELGVHIIDHAVQYSGRIHGLKKVAVCRWRPFNEEQFCKLDVTFCRARSPYKRPVQYSDRIHGLKKVAVCRWRPF